MEYNLVWENVLQVFSVALSKTRPNDLVFKWHLKIRPAWELHSRFSPILTFQTDQHEGQQTDQHELHHALYVMPYIKTLTLLTIMFLMSGDLTGLCLYMSPIHHVKE